MGRSPLYRAEHVGSLLRPAELLKARAECDAAQLSSVENETIRRAVALQESVGFQAVTDGEYRRGIYYSDFLCRGLGGASVYDEIERMFFTDDQNNRIAIPLLRIHDRLRWKGPVHLEEFRFTQALTNRTVKMTLPSPTTIYPISGRNVNREVYPDLGLLYADVVNAYQSELTALGMAGCRYVQLDEVPIALFCDAKRRDYLLRRGIDPNEILSGIFPNLINDALKLRPSSMHVAMHLCRGNNQSGWLAEGGYEPVADMLFNQVNVETYFLEYDTHRAGSFEPLRFVPNDKSVVLGLVSSKGPKLESKDDLKRRIDEAAKYLDLDQMGLSPQCGFASTAPGNKLTPDQQKAKLELVVQVADEVWGSIARESEEWESASIA